MNIMAYILTAINILSFFLVLIDKKRAIRHQWRIPERTFFILAFLGGALGVYLGMILFRHKTRHVFFTWGIVLLIVLNAVFIYYLFPG